jgi:hypothetical protein
LAFCFTVSAFVGIYSNTCQWRRYYGKALPLFVSPHHRRGHEMSSFQ